MPAWLTDLFARYGYFVVFFGVLLENAGIPVPGETILLAAAALSRFGHLSIVSVVIVAITAAVLGDNIGFYIGRRGGRLLLERKGRLFGLTPARLAQFDGFFDRHGAKTVFIARFVTGLRVVGAILAGASTMAWSHFLIFNAAGAVAWATTFGTVGYLLGYSWETIERWIGHLGLVFLALIAVGGVVAFLRSRAHKTR
ncbi:MAG TPA: DedA family protein [Vicinamibacterales bacterium]|nr:DedA family protein [Vicinamibacterales bacterium]